MQENNYIMLLTLTGFSFQYEWLRTATAARALFIGSCALGLNLLTRLTTGLDLIAARHLSVLLVLWFEQVRGRALWQRFVAYCKDRRARLRGSLRFIDRVYSFYRFGSFTNTYVPIFAREYAPAAIRLCPRTFPGARPFMKAFSARCSSPRNRSSSSIRCSCWRSFCWLSCGSACRSKSAPMRVTSPLLAARLHQLLRALHLLGRRLRLGRPLCFDRRGIGGAARRAVAAALSRASESVDLARGHRR